MRDDSEQQEAPVVDEAPPEGAQVETQPAETEAAAPVTVEDIAMKLGWSPKDKWRGPEDGWRDAATYLEHTASETKSLRRGVKDLRDQMQRLTSAQSAAMDRALAEQRGQLEAKWEQAVDEGDKQAAREVQREIQQIDRQREAVDGQEQVVADFIERNKEWFQKDDEATAYAIAQSQRLAGAGKSKADQLEEVDRLVRKRFPELFKDETPAPRKGAPGVLSASTRAASPTPREKGFSDLPQQAKDAWAQFDRDFKRRGFADGYPKDEYARDYWRDQAA